MRRDFPTATSIRQFNDQVLQHDFMSVILLKFPGPLAWEATEQSLSLAN